MTDPYGLDLPLLHAGKVRRLYAWPQNQGADPELILMVATDAISAFDQVLVTPIPDKGAILTQLSQWWFGQLLDVIDNHVISTDVPPSVAGRGVIVEKLSMIPVECVARGYLTGSGWKEYQATQTVCGIPLPDGLQDGSKLPQAIFTPAIKAPMGSHDENVSFEVVAEMHGFALAARLRDLTLALYTRAEEIARDRGIILADTKFEFGIRPDGTIVLADEVLTPDSSRFWDAATWEPGGKLPSFDKQYVRDWLAKESGWDVASDTPAPALPAEVVDATRARYTEAYHRLTGTEFTSFSAPAAAVEKGPRPTRVIVDVMPKPEILDPQGKAVTGALKRLGFDGLSVRQGKRFELLVDGVVDEAKLAEIYSAAEKLLANTVIESFDIRVEQ
ncbi:MAG: phosphoribosylaminoimidazolesuccinocarboxamide synthase [Propionibacteriaceae bacterium]|nr:phosphoribosylaminoimidazolesuccinocarboxamide synthase [Micropruina sp.]